ncbi:hypothetical protein FGG08_003946 [Glutinoglossum americanum]|uniref:GP-PDE domain-containing protein n=1 Tax=Glutinoglossum americanum TaxID=1670608 RepID=A0A9P8L300_9PEZI|nr:hypothetical protein FGG08_003946 [Glutinoglossum americanum]
MTTSEHAPLLEAKLPHYAAAAFTRARHGKTGRQLPQAIAHRGYRAKYPENTMTAFTEAVRVGAHAIETDVHLSKDGVVVLSHDATLKRCFGREGKILDFDWSYLSSLRTLQEPHEHMPRLFDLLEYLASPGLENIWLILDIKVDNDADDVMRLIANTIRQVPPGMKRPWPERINLGCWTAKYLPLCETYLPNFPISHIGFNIYYARRFLKSPSVSSFNLLQRVMVGPLGHRFLCDAHAAGRSVFVWTVNDVGTMRWSIRRGVDGVLTDDPKKFLDVCREFREDIYLEEDRLTVRQYLGLVGFNIVAAVLNLLFRWRHELRDHMKKVTAKRKTMGTGNGNGAAACPGDRKQGGEQVDEDNDG